MGFFWGGGDCGVGRLRGLRGLSGEDGSNKKFSFFEGWIFFGEMV